MNSGVLVILLEDLALSCRLVNRVEQDIVSISFSDDLVIALLVALKREREKEKALTFSRTSKRSDRCWSEKIQSMGYLTKYILFFFL